MQTKRLTFASVQKQRVKKLQKQLAERNLDAFLISGQANRFYLTGWEGDPESGYLLIIPNTALLITDARYTEHATKQTDGFEIFETKEGPGPTLKEIVEKYKLKLVGFESHDLSFFENSKIKKFIKPARLVPVAHFVEELRSVKDEIEIENIKKSVSIAEKTLAHVLKFIKPGHTEKEIAWEMEKYMREAGAQKMAWEPFIVAAGANSSMAHYGAGDTKVKKGDALQIDYGCVYAGYHCDISRVVFVGKPDTKQKEIYNLVIEAQKIGIEMVKEGRNAGVIDKKVRNFLEKRTKYYYKHSLGHGVGLEVHELPSVSLTRKNKLVAGNVITIEPGIYIPGWGGVRIEDMVLVTKTGSEVLTKIPKRIEEVTI
ncbi:MAG: Xaa-Pro peptidase family protein [bacterium]|nr:Xaa-Pro peptidase family protein [bacterium]